jgi:hypothetical protein
MAAVVSRRPHRVVHSTPRHGQPLPNQRALSRPAPCIPLCAASRQEVTNHDPRQRITQERRDSQFPILG